MTLDPAAGPGAPRPGRVLFVLDRYMGAATAVARGEGHRAALETLGWKTDCVEYRCGRRPYDRAALSRTIAEITERARLFDLVYLLKVPSLRLVGCLKRETEARIVFDLTDALWRQYFHGWHDLKPLLQSVDAVFTDNDYCAAYGRRFNPRVFILPYGVETARFDRARAARPGRTDGVVILGWIGSPSTVSALAAVRRPLLAVCARHPQAQARIVGCGNVSPAGFDRVPHTVCPFYDEAAMIEELVRFDVGLFPPPFDDEEFRVRGPSKALLYMAAGVPAVCHDEGMCRKILRDGVNGMLARSPRQWEEKLSRLIESAELRARIGQTGLDFVRARHDRLVVARLLAEAFRAVLDAPANPNRSALRGTGPGRILSLVRGI